MDPLLGFWLWVMISIVGGLGISLWLALRGPRDSGGPGYTVQYGEPFGGHPIKYLCLREGCGAEMETSVSGGSSAIELLLRLRDIHEKTAHGAVEKQEDPHGHYYG